MFGEDEKEEKETWLHGTELEISMVEKVDFKGKKIYNVYKNK